MSAACYSVGDLQRYRTLLRLAHAYDAEGNYAEAEKRYREALALQGKTAAGPSGQAYTLMHLALELSNQERFAEADALFTRADALLAGGADPAEEARLVSYQAIHLANQQKSAEAAEMARKASAMRLALVKQLGVASASGDVGIAAFQTSAGPGRASASLIATPANTAYGDVVQSKYVEAAMLLRDGHLDEAERAVTDARDVLATDERAPRHWLPELLLLQAEIAERRGDLGDAERLLRSSIDASRRQSAGSQTEGTALVTLGRVYYAEGRMSDALAASRDGFAIIRRASADVRFEQAAAFFRAALAEAKQQPAQAQSLYDEMFLVAQMVRSSITAQTLAQATARLAASRQKVGKVIRALQDARSARNAVNERLTLAQADAATLPPQIDALQAELDALNRKVAEREREVQAAAPHYNQIQDAPVEAAQLRQVLALGEALSEVLVGADGGIGFFLDSTGIVAYPVELTEERATQLVTQIRAPFDAGRYKRYDLQAAYDLFVRLFGPVRERLAPVNHLIFVTGGALLSLPAGVLLDQPPEAGEGKPDYTKQPWLVRHHALTLAPSVQSFYNLRSIVMPSHATKPFVGFGDFVPDRDVDTVMTMRGLPDGCRTDVMSVARAPALPNTVAELRAVANALGTGERLVLGEAFSEEGVKASGLSDYRVVYFATHGLLPHELNCWNEPSLITSKPPGESDDGLLTASEIMNLKLDADLVVLSACNTGGPSGDTGGESLSGLARAFFYAGARSMLVTHWSIPDEPTVRLMVANFKHLGGDGMTSAEALRQSQLELIADPRTAHPLNWGAFTLVGDGGSRPPAQPPAPTAMVVSASESTGADTALVPSTQNP